MTADWEIRRLGPADIAQMRAVLALFSRAFEDPETYAGAPPGDDYLARRLASDETFVLAAFAGGALVGGLIAYELRKLEQERSEIYIYDLGVADTHRRRGIATALIERLQALAVERRAFVIYVQADKDDPPAIALYSGLGRREGVLHFDIPVPTPRR